MSVPGRTAAARYVTSPKKATLIDIARSVGVSTGTVDRALNNSKGVNPAAKAVNYRLNRVARSLSIRTSKKIGLIYPKNLAFFWNKIKRDPKSPD
jgi:LacI family transcriptional regulator